MTGVVSSMLWEIDVSVPSPPRTTTRSRPMKSALRTRSLARAIPHEVDVMFSYLQELLQVEQDSHHGWIRSFSCTQRARWS